MGCTADQAKIVSLYRKIPPCLTTCTYTWFIHPRIWLDYWRQVLNAGNVCIKQTNLETSSLSLAKLKRTFDYGCSFTLKPMN